MKKVSVIVPVYNAEKYLERCLDSIVNQTLKDIEIILINDGSKDNSQKIIDEYKEKYPEMIKSKTIKNSGAANARNVALEMAEGEFIGFIDSDDYIEKDMYEKLYNKSQKEEADIVVSGYFVEKENNIVAYQLGHTEQYGKSIKENPDIFVYGVPYLWNKIFKRELMQNSNIKLDKNLRIFEDLEFVYKLYIKASKISKVDEPLYYYIKENEESLTATFSAKFFDIITAMKNLKTYIEENGCYKELEDYLIYIALNHIYIRCNMKVPAKQLRMKFKYIDGVFEFLNKEFPNWKEHEYYFKNKNRNKAKYINKIYWKFITYMQIIKLDKISKLISRIITKLKSYRGLGNSYIKYYEKLPIKDNVILIDSQHGNDINGNMFYILKELASEKYKDFKVYLGVNANRIEEFKTKLGFYNINNVELVKNETKKYMKILATTKYLFTDTSFMANYIKKEGQVYLNTWHGTPLKTLGRSTKNDFENIANLQKNFVVSDYLLYPSEYMMNLMLEDYMIHNISKNKILLCGYPRNSIFLDKERGEKVKKELNLEGKELIVYMPTWRGTMAKKDTDEYINTLKQYLKYISENLKENQLLYVNVHPYVKDYIKLEGHKNVLAFPKQYETYDFVNACDILITDYSSIFFDFAITKKKIILFTYDEQKYLSERGLYLGLDELPFPRVYDEKALIDEINNKEIVNYDNFIEKYCKYDDKDVPEKICNKVILNKNNDLKIVDMPQNNKKNVLILIKNFADKNINKKLFELIENTEECDYNFYIGYITRNVRKYSYNLSKLPRKINYMGQLYSMCNISLLDKVKFALCNREKIKINLDKKKYDNIFKKELKRIYDNIEFDTILLFGEENKTRIHLFSKYQNARKILYTPKMQEEYKEIYDYILTEEQLNGIKDLNNIVKIGG